MLYLQTALNGLVLGLIYTGLAVGLSLTMGVLGVINVAHSAFLILAALVTWQLVTSTGIDPLLAAALLVPVLFVIGAGLERVLIRRVAREAQTTALLVLFGVLIVLESIGILIWTTDTRVLDIGYLSGAVAVGRLSLPLGRLAGALLSLVAVTVLHLFLTRTLTGRGIRAMAQNRDAAALVGIKVPRLTTIVFGIGTALAALGGVSLALAFPFTPQGHIQWLAWAFLVVVIGGLGSVGSTLLAGLVVGLIVSFAGVLLPFEYVYLIVYGLLAFSLLVRSEGLLGARERRI
jgi:branched-chain amino acid transport system permease protein